MSNNIELDQQIDRYIKGQMSAAELSDFETLMANNLELTKEVQLQTAIAKAIYKKNMLDLLKGDKKRVVKHPFTRKTILQIASYATAACFAGVLIFGHFYQRHKYSQLSDEFYQPYQSIYDMPSRGEALVMNASDSLLLDGIRLIKAGNGEKAIAQLSLIVQKPETLKYIGVDVAQWYLALAELKEGNKKEGKAMLQKVKANEQSDFSLKASKLLIGLE